MNLPEGGDMIFTDKFREDIDKNTFEDKKINIKHEE